MQTKGESLIGQYTLREDMKMDLTRLKIDGGENTKNLVKSSLCYQPRIRRTQVPNSNRIRTENVLAWAQCQSKKEYEEAARVKLYGFDMHDRSATREESPPADWNDPPIDEEPTVEDENVPDSSFGYERTSTYTDSYVDKMIEEFDHHWPLGKNSFFSMLFHGTETLFSDERMEDLRYLDQTRWPVNLKKATKEELEPFKASFVKWPKHFPSFKGALTEAKMENEWNTLISLLTNPNLGHGENWYCKNRYSSPTSKLSPIA